MAKQTTAVLSSRKPYAQPRLTRYGSVRELTRELGCYLNKDGGSNAVCRRSP
jgi:hypothetical protein